MTRYYIDVVNGSDAAAGTSWGTARKTLLNLTGVSAGDEISFAKTPDCDEVSVTGAFSGTNGTYFLTGNASLGCKHIVRAVSSWTGYNSSTVSTSTGRGSFTPIAGEAYTAFNGGSLAFPASPAANTKYGVMDLGSTQDLSGYVDLSIWLYLNTTGAWTNNHLVIKLCSDAAGDTAVETFNITLTQNPGVIGGTNIQLLKGSALSSTVRSVAFYSGSSAPVGSSSLRWSCLTAYPSSAVLKANDWVYNADRSILGQVSFIDDGDTSTPDIYFAYVAHRNLNDWSGVSLKRRRGHAVKYSDKSTTATAQVQPLRYGGSSDATRVTYKGGYNTGSDTVDGITFIDDSTAGSAANSQHYFHLSATYQTVNFITMENLWVGGHYGPGNMNGASDTSTLNLILNNCASLGCNTSAYQMGASASNNRPIVKLFFTDCILGPGNYVLGNTSTGANTVVDVLFDTCYTQNASITAGSSGIAGSVAATDSTFYITTINLPYNNGYGLGGDPTIWWTEFALVFSFTNVTFKGGNGRLTVSSRDATGNGRWHITGTGVVFDYATCTLSGRGVWDAVTTTQKTWVWSAAVFNGFTITGAAGALYTYNIEVRDITWTDYDVSDTVTWQHADIRNCWFEASPSTAYYLITLNHCYVVDCTFKAISPSTGGFFGGHVRIASGTADITEMQGCNFYDVVLAGAFGGGAGGLEAYRCSWYPVTNGTAYCGYASFGLRILSPNPDSGGGKGGIATDASGAPWLGPAPGFRHGLCYIERHKGPTNQFTSVIYYGTELVAARYALPAVEVQRVPGEYAIRVAAYPVPIANVAVVAGKEVTASIWVYRYSTWSTAVGYLKAKAGQLSNDQPEYSTSTSLGLEVWEQISLLFTPTVSGIIQFHIEAFQYVDMAGFSCTQA